MYFVCLEVKVDRRFGFLLALFVCLEVFWQEKKKGPAT